MSGQRSSHVLWAIYTTGAIVLAVLGLSVLGIRDHAGPHDGWLRAFAVAGAGAAVATALTATRALGAGVVLYLLQIGCLVGACTVDRGTNGVRVAPPLVAVAVAIEVVGAVALMLTAKPGATAAAVRR